MSALARDWQRPVAGEAEETHWIEVSEDGTEHPRPAIRWHVSAEGLARIKAKMACWDCLTPFPAPPRRDTWATWKTSGFNWLTTEADAKRRVRSGCCPICGSEISDEMLALQIDTARTEEEAKLKAGKEAWLAEDRARFAFEDERMARALGLIQPVAPPSRRKSAKRRGES